jgi:hypothetical protein
VFTSGAIICRSRTIASARIVSHARADHERKAGWAQMPGLPLFLPAMSVLSVARGFCVGLLSNKISIKQTIFSFAYF